MKVEAGSGRQRDWRRAGYTPMCDLLRGRISGRCDWRRPIAESDLPEAVKETITQLVKRTRLWRTEKHDVAVELVAHFQDAVAAGHGEEDALKAFGSPDVAARLIRRAKKRNRPWPFHALRYSMWSFVGLLGLMGLYAAVWLWLVSASPVVSVDYLAKINEPIMAVPEKDRAWPIYRDAMIKWNFVGSQPGGMPIPLALPHESDWPKVELWLREHSALLDEFRRAAVKPHLGREITVSWDIHEEDIMALTPPDRLGDYRRYYEKRPHDDHDRLKGESLYGGVHLPHLGPLRLAARWLAADITLAAMEGDTRRALDDFAAVIGMARHLREPDAFLIHQLVSISVARLAIQHLAAVVDQQPRLLADEQLRDVAHKLAAMRALGEIDVTGERLMVLDAIQRMFSDNGRGDGRFTLRGVPIREFLASNAGTCDADDDDRGYTMLATFIALAPRHASRMEAVEVVERWHALTVADAFRPLWGILAEKSSAARYLDDLTSDYVGELRYMPIRPLIGDLTAAVRTGRVFQAEVEALETAIALELYRRHHGAYPDDLAELVPRYRPGVPVDHSTGLPLCYRLVDGRPVLYGRGIDGEDNGGQRPADGKSALDEGVAGDWILYPPTE